jgi:hypothetical protein
MIHLRKSQWLGYAFILLDGNAPRAQAPETIFARTDALAYLVGPLGSTARNSSTVRPRSDLHSPSESPAIMGRIIDQAMIPTSPGQ